MIAGLYGAMATVVAVRHAERSGGRGQVVDLSLLDAMFSILGPEAAIHRLTRRVRRRVGSASESTSPRNVYATRDGGWVAISASTQAMTERLFRAIGRDDLNGDPAFRTNAERIVRRDDVDAIVGGFIEKRDLADAVRFFEEAGVTPAHPAQIEVLNRVFSPDPEKVAYARGVVEAFELGLERGTASVNLDGKMVDIPVYKRAEVILARARAVEEAERRKAAARARHS